MQYTELQVTTNFTFLRGGSHPEELVAQAVLLGYKTLAITDRNTLAGIVRAHAAARGKDIRILPGCRIDLIDGPSLLALPVDREGYAWLSGLLTKGNRRTEKGRCDLERKDIFSYRNGIKWLLIPPASLNEQFALDAAFINDLQEYRSFLGNDLYLAASCAYEGLDTKRLHRISQLAVQHKVPMVATNDVHYHEPRRRELQDILTCIREKCTIYNAGYRLHQHAERHLKTDQEMKRLFRQYPDAIARTQEIADACRFSLDSLEYIYPRELSTGGRTPQEELEMHTWAGAAKRFPDGIPEEFRKNIVAELAFIARRNYASYFLTVHDFVSFARKRAILCQGRGSAANSLVCYCLHITSVDPRQTRLLFARFMSDARDEPPDIDVDFEHERREEVMQYIYEKYGRDRAGIVATVTQVHHKGAVRDVGKAMGLSVDAINKLSSSMWELTEEWLEGKTVSSQGFDAKDPHLLKVLQLTEQYVGFPRQLGQHTGGFIITEGRLSDLCPVLNARMKDRTCIEWNKDDVEALGFLKVDVLALGMLTCLRKGFDLLRTYYGKDYDLDSIPKEQPEVYEMICRADTLGVFQIESRAQMSMLPRLKPKKFYDLVIEVAIVRPGPIQGDMVHPYLKNREKIEQGEPVDYGEGVLKDILKKTLGVPLFQEQAMEIAIKAAGFTDSEADELRRSMATFKAKGKVSFFEQKLVNGMVGNGFDKAFAQRVFRQLQGFGSYGFPESHAASFALLVYASAWIKCWYPDVFAAALLNSMPMGFYQPAQIIIDARNHGVMVRPVDINHSAWDNTLEGQAGNCLAIRLGFRQVKGLNEPEMSLLRHPQGRHFTNIPAIRDLGISQTALELLADADAFNSIGLNRRQALWEVAALGDRPIGIYEGQASESAFETAPALPVMTAAAHVVQDYSSTSLSLRAHPVSFVREQLLMLQVAATNRLTHCTDGMTVRVAGLVLVRQRPGTASGICFITIEDETGVANLVVFKKLFDKFRKEILCSKLLMVEGKVQIGDGGVIHVVVRRCSNLTSLLERLSMETQDISGLSTTSRADEDGSEIRDARLKKKQAPKIVQGEIFPGGRNFR